jgi:adenylate cyclase
VRIVVPSATTRELKDVFAVQDEVVGTIVAILAMQVTKAEAERTSSKHPDTWHAYDYYLRATDLLASYRSSMSVSAELDFGQKLNALTDSAELGT